MDDESGPGVPTGVALRSIAVGVPTIRSPVSRMKACAHQPIARRLCPARPQSPVRGCVAAALLTATACPFEAVKAADGLVNEWLRRESPAFTAWDLGGQIRGRVEVFDDAHNFEFPNRDFQRTGADNDNSYFLLREMVHVGYRAANWLSAYAEARDSSSFGDDHSRRPSDDAFDLNQAYVRVGNPEVFPVSLKLGRQAMAYGDERLIGAADWSNVTRSFDAALLRFENPQVTVDGFVAQVVRPVDGAFNESDDHDLFSGIYASTPTLVPWQETQLYVLARNASPGASVSPRDIYTVGLRIRSLPGKLGGWDYLLEAVEQMGSVNVGGLRRDQDARAASIGFGHTWKEAPGGPRLGLEYCYSSGDSNPNDGVSETLDNLFPTNHKFYGNMDFEGWRNLHSPRVVLGFRPAAAVSVVLDYQLYWLADTRDLFYPPAGAGRIGNGYGYNPGFSSFAGSELNLNVTYDPTRWLGFRAGYGHFFTGGYVEESKAALGGATDADWLYFQTTVNF